LGAAWPAPLLSGLACGAEAGGVSGAAAVRDLVLVDLAVVDLVAVDLLMAFFLMALLAFMLVLPVAALAVLPWNAPAATSAKMAVRATLPAMRSRLTSASLRRAASRMLA
jgi:hypothetical protein